MQFKAMKNWFVLGGLALVVSMSACDDNGEIIRSGIIIESDFEQNTNNWEADLAEYSTATDTSIIEFRSGRTPLPEPLDKKRSAFMLQSHNRSDDMFMFLKRKVNGLKANQTYTVVFNIDLGTSYPANGIGAGGSPGSSVYLKAGASTIEPAKKLEDGFYHFNLDKGAQSQEGKDFLILGNIANGLEKEDYKIVQRDNMAKPLEVKANANGEIWLCVGTDSGYEGLTRLYYDKIKTTIAEKVIN